VAVCLSTGHATYLQVREQGVITDRGNVSRRVLGGAKQLKRRVRARLGWFGRLEILSFRGYGTPERLHISGRVLEASGVIHPDPGGGARTGEGQQLNGTWANLRAAFRRFGSDEVPNARLVARFGGQEVEFETDNDGYFDFTLCPTTPAQEGWNEVELELLESFVGFFGTRAMARVLVPLASAEFGVISDLDDTVIQTRATHLLKMLRIVAFKNGRTRIPFAGVSGFYRSLEKGPDERGDNPIFYVSRSPWNLYDLFEMFFVHHDVPRGPLFLRDLAVLEPPSRLLGKCQDKLTRIRRLLDTYPRLAFVLIGDSGQQDPQMYRQIALQYPGRIRTVYIRDVTSPERDREVREIAREVSEAGVPMILAHDTVEAAEHAATLGLIHPKAVDEVERAARKEAEGRSWKSGSDSEALA
jgi:phosphatidate phosphatase APP1